MQATIVCILILDRIGLASAARSGRQLKQVRGRKKVLLLVYVTQDE